MRFANLADRGDARSFERSTLEGVRMVAFSIAPGDLDGDGDIDLATGSYNAELTANRDARSMLGVDVGTAVLRRGDDGYDTKTRIDNFIAGIDDMSL